MAINHKASHTKKTLKSEMKPFAYANLTFSDFERN